MWEGKRGERHNSITTKIYKRDDQNTWRVLKLKDIMIRGTLPSFSPKTVTHICSNFHDPLLCFSEGTDCQTPPNRSPVCWKSSGHSYPVTQWIWPRDPSGCAHSQMTRKCECLESVQNTAAATAAQIVTKKNLYNCLIVWQEWCIGVFQTRR